MKIIVVCGAGASSTFVAVRIRRTAADRGVHATVTPRSESTLLAELGDPAIAASYSGAVLLLGAHLADRAEALRQAASGYGIPTAVMPESVFSAADGNAALDLALEVAGAAS